MASRIDNSRSFSCCFVEITTLNDLQDAGIHMSNYNSPIFITIGNCKGGVGKTTSIVNLASYLAICGQKVLIVDTDSQANCSSILHEHFDHTREYSLVDALEDTSGEVLLSEIASDTYHPNIAIVSNTTQCMLWERKVSQKAEAVMGMRQLINRDPGINQYDYVFFDTPPNLGVMMNNALMASDYVIIPIPPSSRFSLDGLAAYLSLISSIRTYNHTLRLLAVLITQYDPLWGNSKDNLALMQNYFVQRGITIFNSIIHKCPAIDAAHVERRTIFESAPKSSSADDYSSLGIEMQQILKTALYPEHEGIRRRMYGRS